MLEADQEPTVRQGLVATPSSSLRPQEVEVEAAEEEMKFRLDSAR